MNVTRPPVLLTLLLAAGLASSAVAQAPIQISPPAQGGGSRPPQAPKPKAHPAPKAAPKAPAAPAPGAAKKPAPQAAPPAAPPGEDDVWPPPPGAPSGAPVATAPASTALASAFTAYQRGQYLTAFAEATRLAGDAGDPKAMALLGELYANGN